MDSLDYSKRLLIGTNNEVKFSEIQNILDDYDVLGIQPKDLGLTDDIEETGLTFAENSKIKAAYYWQKLHRPLLADDAGVEIEAFNGEPGVHTRRWLGRVMNDEEVTDEVLKRIDQVPVAKRQAVMKVVMTLIIDEQTQVQVTGIMEGEIRPSGLPTPPKMPISSIFWVPVANKFFSQFNLAETRKFSHRAKAIEQLAGYLNQL